MLSPPRDKLYLQPCQGHSTKISFFSIVIFPLAKSVPLCGQIADTILNLLVDLIQKKCPFGPSAIINLFFYYELFVNYIVFY